MQFFFFVFFMSLRHSLSFSEAEKSQLVTSKFVNIIVQFFAEPWNLFSNFSSVNNYVNLYKLSIFLFGTQFFFFFFFLALSSWMADE